MTDEIMLERYFVFRAWNSPGWIALVAVCLLAFAVLTILLLRYERQLVSRTVGSVLLALRLAMLATIFLVVLEPVIEWRWERDITGTVIVAVDVSNSMATRDVHATPEEKQRWAHALGMIAHAGEAAGQEQDKNEDANRAEARQANTNDIMRELDELSRKDIAVRLITGPEQRWLQDLQQSARVEFVVFGGNALAIEPQSLERAVRTPPPTTDDESSDLRKALLARPVSESSPLLGMLVLSDGRNTAEGDPIQVAEQLRVSEIPVFGVLLGSILRPKDVAITSIDAPRDVFKQDKVRVRATVRTAGFDGEEVETILESDGAPLMTKRIPSATPEVIVEFELDPLPPGRHFYTLRSAVLPGETRDDNNHKSFAVNVVDDRARVLLVDEEARWEFRYLDNALSRDDRIDISRVLFDQPYLQVLDAPFFPRALPTSTGVNDKDTSPFADCDLVIMGDVSPVNVPAEDWNQLEEFVSESGGTLVLLAGRRYMPLQQQSDAFQRLIPLRDQRPISIDADASPPQQRGFHLSLTAQGSSESVFQLTGDADENQRVWSELPGHSWGIVGTPKSGATALVEAVAPADDPDFERGPIIVRQNYGFGQVLWVGIDSTWRWRHRVGDQYHHRFWGQIARWAADNKAAAGNEFVRFGPEHTDVESGEDVIVRAQWSAPFLRRFPKLTAKVEVRERDQADAAPIAEANLRPASGQPLVYEGRVAALEPGDYSLKLTIKDAVTGTQPLTSPLFVNPRQTPELVDLSADRHMLAKVAEASGGALLEADQLDDFASRFRDVGRTETLSEELLVWNHWLVFLLLIGLLTSEWLLRKLNGLP